MVFSFGLFVVGGVLDRQSRGWQSGVRLASPNTITEP
jgi:hypothetical protein